MTCLIKSRYRKELNHYASILGSEEAAYYVLAMNNGYTLDMAPDGSQSSLYDALVLTNGGDEDAAILSKSVVYTPLYTDKYGDWTENFDITNGSEEPSITTLNSDASLCDNDVIKSVLNNPLQTINRLLEMEQSNQMDRDPVITQALREEREQFIEDHVQEFIDGNPSATDEEIERERQYWRTSFNSDKLNAVVSDLIGRLLDIFGDNIELDPSTGFFVGTDPFSNIQADILNHLRSRLNTWTEDFVSTINNKEEFTIITLLRQSILNVEPETQLRTVIESYLRMFANSQPMQEAFKLLKDDFKNRSVDSMIREIANYISGDVLRTSQKRERVVAINKFWQKFKNFLRKIIPGLHKKDYNTKRNILDSLTLYFATVQDLDDAENDKILFDIRMWNTKDINLKVGSKDVIKRIKSGIESRIKSINSVTREQFDEQELLTLQSWLSDIEALEQSPIDQLEDDEYQIIDKFLVNGLQEIHDASIQLQSMKDLEASDINAQKLMRIKTDVVGFYENILTQYILPLLRNSNHPLVVGGGAINNSARIIDNALQYIKSSFDEQLERYTDFIVDKFVDENVDVGDKERMRINMKLWLRNKINNGELAFLDKYFNSGVSSQSPIVRMLDVFLREARLDSHKNALRIKKLYKLYRDATSTLNDFSFKNFLRNFCETLSDGTLSGNFVAPINKGQFDKNLADGIAELDKKYNIKLDQDGNRIWESEDIWKAYQDDRDDLIERIGGHRRYTAEYYKDRRQFLSQGTIEIKQKLRRDIDKILQKCTEEIEHGDKKLKIVVEANLSTEDRSRLEELRKQQDQLGNTCDIIYDSATGKILDIRQKTGVALQMAREIAAWNAFKLGKIKYRSNNKAYKDALAALEAKYGAGSRQVSLFKFRNTENKLSDAYFKKLSEIITPGDSSARRVELLAIRKSILDACKGRKGYYEPNLDLLSEQAFAKLKQIDEELDIEKPEGGDIDIEEYEKFVGQRYVKKQGLDITYFEWLKQQYEARLSIDPDAMRKFYDRFMYTKHTTKGDKVVPLSCFVYNGPKDDSYVEKEGVVGQYMEMDEFDSYYADRMYDENDDNFIQPDQVVYRNQKYYEIINNPKMNAFYSELMNIMDLIWSLLPNMSKQYRYQMPQRRAKNNRLLFRKDFLDNAKFMIQSSFGITERDTNYNEEFTRRPDGSIVETIPIRWIRKLDNPNQIDTNIIGSVAEMLEMATNFNLKQQFLPIMEAINFKLYGGFAGIGTNSVDQAERFKTHMSMYMYGRMRAGFRKFKKLSPVERFLQKFTQSINTAVWNKYMIHNWNSVAKNGIDSFWSLMAEASGGKYFSQEDLRVAGINCFGRDIIKGGPIGSIASINVPTMTAALMQYNRVSGSINDIFDGAELSRVRRALGKTKTGEYTAIDYMYKGLVTEAIYNSYRLIVNPSTGKAEFMNREQAQYAYVKIGATNEDGEKAYKDAQVTLRNAYYKDEYGIVQIKPEYLDIIKPIIDEKSGKRSSKLETRVSNTILERCAVINGMLDEMDKNVISQNYIGATILLMRGWLLSQQIDYNKRGHDFAIYADGDDLKTMQNKSSFTKIANAIIDTGASQIIQEDENYQGQYNFGTGTVDKGAWLSLLSAYKQWVKSGMYLRHLFNSNKMTQQQKMQVTRMNVCIFSVMMLSVQTFIYGSLVEGDPDNWVYKYLYNMTVSSISERASQLGHAALLFVLSELIKTPAVVTGWINDISYIPAALWDLVAMVYDWASNGEEDIDSYDVIKQGSYKNKQKYQRDLLKASSEIPDINNLGIDNMFKNFSMDAIDSRGEWFAQIAPTPWISYIPRYNGNKKGQKGIYGLLLNDESNTNESIGMWQSLKNTLKGQDYAGESGTTNRKKSKNKSSNKRRIARY